MTHNRKPLEPESKEEKIEAKPLDRNWKTHLTPAILNHTLFGYLCEEEAITLAAASREFEEVPEYQRVTVQKLLRLTANPTEENVKIAELLVKQSYRFALHKMPFTEELCGQREWKEPVSALQYAAWAGDMPLWRLYLKQLPDGEAKLEAFEQLTDLQKKGHKPHGTPLHVVYRLIHAYTEYVKRPDWWSESKLWREVGNKQFHSVVNLLQWFCSRIPLSPLPNFNQAPDRSCLLHHKFPLNLTSENSFAHGHTSWALYKGRHEKCGGGEYALMSEVRIDLEAIKHFCKVRSKDLNYDISQLKQELREQGRLKFVENSRCLVM